MTESLEKGLKGLAFSAYGLSKLRPGVQAAADMQTALLKVESNIASGAKNAADLNAQLREVKRTAIEVGNASPFSAEQVLEIENSLLKAGLKLSDVVGQSGAAFAATALAALSGVAPEQVGDDLAKAGGMFNIKGDQYGEAADWLTKIDDSAATSLPELMYGLNMSGASANALGISLKDTVTALGMLAPLGDRAGSSLDNFFKGTLGNSKDKRAVMKKYGLDFFENGRFIGMEKATDQLRAKMGRIKNEEERLTALIKLFGDEGGRAANQFVFAEKSFGQLNDQAERALGLQAKMNIQQRGLNAQLEALKGTWKTTLASVFSPMLGTLTDAVAKANELAGALGKVADENPDLSAKVSGGAAAVVGAGALYSLWHLAKGGLSGGKVIKGMFGKGVDTAAGVVKGKALEAAAGVTPVYVVNMPDGGLGLPNLPSVPGMPKKSGGAGLASRLKLLGLGAAPLLARAGVVGAGAAAGWEAGSYANKQWIDGTKTGEAIGRAVAQVWQHMPGFLGGDAAREALVAERRAIAQERQLLAAERAKPLRVLVDVQNGNIVAAVQQHQTMQARRN